MEWRQNGQPEILLYQIPVQEMMRLLPILQRHGCRAVQVTAGQYGIPLGQLAQGSVQQEAKQAGAGSPLPESMMVFCGCGDPLLDCLLADMRQSGVRISSKAVLTPHNKTWTTVELYQALRQERAAISAQKRQK